MKFTTSETVCHRCHLPAKQTAFPPTGRLLNCEMCGEFAIRSVDGQDIYTELRLPYGSEFYEAIGRFVVAFSMVESGLDFLTHSIFHNAGGKRIFKRLPKTFDTKITFLAKSLQQLEPLQFRAEEILKALKAFERIVERRHYYIHGMYATNYVPPYSFEKNIIDGETLSFSQLEADIPSIREDEISALAIGAFFMSVSNQLMPRSGSASRPSS